MAVLLKIVKFHFSNKKHQHIKNKNIYYENNFSIVIAFNFIFAHKTLMGTRLRTVYQFTTNIYRGNLYLFVFEDMIFVDKIFKLYKYKIYCQCFYQLKNILNRYRQSGNSYLTRASNCLQNNINYMLKGLIKKLRKQYVQHKHMYSFIIFAVLMY